MESKKSTTARAEEMDKIGFVDSPQDGEEATVEEGSCWASDIGWSSIWICIINWRRKMKIPLKMSKI